MTGRVKINLTCDRPFYDAASAYASDRGKSVSAVMREALVDRMEQENWQQVGTVANRVIEKLAERMKKP